MVTGEADATCSALAIFMYLTLRDPNVSLQLSSTWPLMAYHQLNKLPARGRKTSPGQDSMPRLPWDHTSPFPLCLYGDDVYQVGWPSSPSACQREHRCPKPSALAFSNTCLISDAPVCFSITIPGKHPRGFRGGINRGPRLRICIFESVVHPSLAIECSEPDRNFCELNPAPFFRPPCEQCSGLDYL